MPQKNKTRDQVTAMQEKAVRFLRDVKGDEDAAAEFEAMSPEEYAEHKHVRLVENPCSGRVQITIRRATMPKPTMAELKAQLEDLQTENEDLQAENDELSDKLDSIVSLAGDDEDDSDDDEDDDDVEDDDLD